MMETQTLTAVYLVQMVGTAFLAALLAHFYRAYGHSYLREWSWSWLALCMYVAGGLAAMLWTRTYPTQHPLRLGVTGFTLFAGYAQIVFLLFGTYAVARGQRVAERWRNIILSGCVVVGVLLAVLYTSEPALFDIRFFIRIGVRSGAAGIAYLVAGVWLARHLNWRHGVGRGLMLASFLLYGGQQTAYFINSMLELLGVGRVGPELAWLGFADSLLQFGMGMGMVIWLLEDERDELERTAEALRRSETHLRRSQRLETVGQLAGGVAHDFNNLLTVISGRGQRLLQRLPRDSEDWVEVSQIDQAAARGAALVRQLLAFSRKQVLAPQHVHANETVQHVRRMLQRVIGEEITFNCDLAPDLAWTLVDPVQLEQVLVNLALNARDAMPDGGTLTISTRNQEVAIEESDSLVGLMPGEHIEITVRDTGVGMDEKTRRHIFEPFYTTKGVGEGSGLGMAMVYGVVRQSGGTVVIDSRPEEGTAVHVYLPRVAPPPRAEADQRHTIEHRAQPASGRRATVLVVEDDSRIRGLLDAVLRDNGYETLIAEDGAAALEIAQRNDQKIDLLLTDIVMPKIGGPELADRLQVENSDLRVVYMSGYSEEIVSSRIDSGERFLLEKPFSLPDLLRCVHETLDR
ncbi:MAG: ATP-binding protein [Acidobacteriota bacterium]|jgi:signal transduction histidine kinase